MAICDIPLQWKYVGDRNYIMQVNYNKPSIGFHNEFSEETTMNECYNSNEKVTELTYAFDVIVISKSTKEIVYNANLVCGSKKDAEKLALADLAAKYAGKDLSEFVLDLHFAISQVGDGFVSK